MADLTITAANVVAGNNAMTEHGRAGATITAGQVVYLDGTTGKYLLADSNSATASARKPRGIALHNASNNQPLTILTGGDITIGATVDPEASGYYLSDTPGGICPHADIGDGEYIVQVGLAKSATVLAVRFIETGVAFTA